MLSPSDHLDNQCALSYERESTWEPLLATGVKRTDIILGQFSRGAFNYTVLVLVSLGMLVVAAIFAHKLGHFPALTLLRLTPGPCALLILVMVVGGLESIALGLFISSYSSRGVRAKRDEFSEDPNGILAEPMWLLFFVIMFAGPIALSAHPFDLSFLLPACPILNGQEGVGLIFERMQLPGNPDRVLLLVRHTTASFVPAMILSSVAGSALFLFLAIRNLESGGRRRRRAH
jgi:hypothetical protein